MEKVKSRRPFAIFGNLKSYFVKKSPGTNKPEINWSALKIFGFTLIVLSIVFVLILPNEQDIPFSHKSDEPTLETPQKGEKSSSQAANNSNANIWASPAQRGFAGAGSQSEVNYNTSMIVGSESKNAKTQIRQGQRLPLRILDKFIVSDSPVPVIADLLFSTETESGLSLPAGTRFYGEASFQKGQERAQIRFTQISVPNGQIRQISGMAFGKDGQPGIEGRIHSDGAKNTAGQVLTTFIAGLAGGSVQTDIMGNSRGGIQNGLLSAVSSTAKDRAQSYGESLKTEREWIEVRQGTECDATFSQALDLQMSGDSRE